MRRLFRSILAVLALGLTAFGCGKAGTENSSSEGSASAASWVTLTVPGMT